MLIVHFLMQYFLKARFHFNKNQFADLMLIIGITGTISQVYIYIYPLQINTSAATF